MDHVIKNIKYNNVMESRFLTENRAQNMGIKSEGFCGIRLKLKV
jgi:hypothetical protein